MVIKWGKFQESTLPAGNIQGHRHEVTGLLNILQECSKAHCYLHEEVAELYLEHIWVEYGGVQKQFLELFDRNDHADQPCGVRSANW